MNRLKSRVNFPPGGFQVIIPATNQKEPFSGSFEAAVEFVMRVRRANPGLSKQNGWKLDRGEVEDYVEAQNVKRLLSSGYTTFVNVYTAPPPPRPAQKKSQDAPFAAVGRVLSGAVLLADWVGHGAQVVSESLANTRANICADCPKNTHNDPGNRGFWETIQDRLTTRAAAQIRRIVQLKNEMKLKTVRESELGVCSACDCPLPLKVWTPAKYILNVIPDEVFNQLAPGCWVRADRDQERASEKAVP